MERVHKQSRAHWPIGWNKTVARCINENVDRKINEKRSSCHSRFCTSFIYTNVYCILFSVAFQETKKIKKIHTVRCRIQPEHLEPIPLQKRSPIPYVCIHCMCYTEQPDVFTTSTTLLHCRRRSSTNLCQVLATFLDNIRPHSTYRISSSDSHWQRLLRFRFRFSSSQNWVRERERWSIRKFCYATSR